MLHIINPGSCRVVCEHMYIKFGENEKIVLFFN